MVWFSFYGHFRRHIHKRLAESRFDGKLRSVKIFIICVENTTISAVECNNKKNVFEKKGIKVEEVKSEQIHVLKSMK